jgi:hypothetical protein
LLIQIFSSSSITTHIRWKNNNTHLVAEHCFLCGSYTNVGGELSEPNTSLLYTANGNFVNGQYAPGADGFNLADAKPHFGSETCCGCGAPAESRRPFVRLPADAAAANASGGGQPTRGPPFPGVLLDSEQLRRHFRRAGGVANRANEWLRNLASDAFFVCATESSLPEM